MIPWLIICRRVKQHDVTRITTGWRVYNLRPFSVYFLDHMGLYQIQKIAACAWSGIVDYVFTTNAGLAIPTCITAVKLQNLSWYKTGFVSRHVLYLSRLQNWICPKTGQYKTCIVSNSKIEVSIQATKPKPWQSHLTSETVEIFIQNEKAGLVSTQSRFWSGRFSVGAKPILLHGA